MKKAMLSGTVCFIVLGSLFGGHSWSQDKGAAPPKPPSAEEMKAMMEGMQKWMDSIQPGKHHELLDQFTGTWETVMKMWMAGPQSPPSETKGVSEIKWVLGKRFLMEEHKGEVLMPDASGAVKPIPYEGIGMMGYDKTRNLYVGTWASSAGTNLLHMMDEPMLDVYGRTVKYVKEVISKDKQVFSIYDLHASDDYKVVEIVYTRKK
jgi:hypothetical protein